MILSFSSQEAAEDIPDAMAVTTEHIAFTLDDGTAKDEEIHVIPLHKKPGNYDDSHLKRFSFL